MSAVHTTSLPPPVVSLPQAFWFWLKLGFISFGGPTGQIALMHQELVERRRWMSEQRFLHALNYCMLLPGPEATQLAIYIGWLVHRTAGGIVAGVLFVLPSLLILILLTWIYLVFGDQSMVAAVLTGVKPAVVAIVLAAAWRIGSRSLHNRWLIALAVAALIAITVFDVPFPAIVIGAALLGMLGSRMKPEVFRQGRQQHQVQQTALTGPALIDDDTPTPEHAQFRWGGLLRVSLIGLILGLAVWGTLAVQLGTSGALAQMGWFFTKAAFLTFGGAYAVLPYVYQGAVDLHGWLTPTQMMDGLALGETTPGPLIMIVAFVGFVGGWTGALFGTDSLFFAGVAGACVATFFTFLPSFVFILAGGPLVESTRGNLKFTAPLTAISAAVVGVIVSLALFFAEHVFGSDRPLAQWDWVAVGITALACIAVLRYRVGTITLICVCALASLVISLLG